MSLLLLFYGGTVTVPILSKNTLCEAIVERFIKQPAGHHNDLYNALSGRLYYEHAPEQEAFPYGIFSIISEVPEQLLNTNDIVYRYVIQFNMYSEIETEVYDLYNYLISLFDNCHLLILNKYHISMVRSLSDVLCDEDNVYDYMTRYNAILSETT